MRGRESNLHKVDLKATCMTYISHTHTHTGIYRHTLPKVILSSEQIKFS